MPRSAPERRHDQRNRVHPATIPQNPGSHDLTHHAKPSPAKQSAQPIPTRSSRSPKPSGQRPQPGAAKVHDGTQTGRAACTGTRCASVVFTFTRRLPVPRRSWADNKPEGLQLTLRRPHGKGIRPPARLDVDIPGSRQRHHTRRRAPPPGGMARPGLVRPQHRASGPLSSGPGPSARSGLGAFPCRCPPPASDTGQHRRLKNAQAELTRPGRHRRGVASPPVWATA
jgi:hypothetical protein